MLAIYAINHFAWSLIWVIIFVIQESNYFPLSPHDAYLFNWGITVFHLASLVLILVFYCQSYSVQRKHLKLNHYEQKFWLLVGVGASLANILKNVYSESMGLSNLTAFIPATLQNTLVYFASIYCIILLDSWNMEAKSPCVKSSVYILIVSQMIINLTLFMEALNSYVNPPPSQSLFELFFLTIFRSFLILFGGKKVVFLYRKVQRWNCELFTYAVIYLRLPTLPQYDEDPTRILHSVSQRFTGLDDLMNPVVINYNDPSQFGDALLPSSSYMVKY